MPKVTPRTRASNATKFPHVVEALRRRIVSGGLKPGDRLPTFAEMRAEFGVTPGTVSRALLSLEQEGLIVREQGRGVFVAPPPVKQRQHALGCMGFDPAVGGTPYYLGLIEGIQSVAHREKLDVTLLHSTEINGLERIDGVLMHGERAEDLRDRLPHGMPCVAMMQSYDDIPSVMADDYSGLRDATRYLVSLGHRRIACHVFTLSPVIQVRLAGYLAALHEAGIKEEPGWVRNITVDVHGLRALGHASTTEWLQDGWRDLGCTAILCQNDAFASGVLRALREANIRVPEDVSVIGYDGTEECEHTTPRLTSVEVPLQKIGAMAAERLLRQIQDPQSEVGALTLPNRLAIRDSTGPVREIRRV